MQSNAEKAYMNENTANEWKPANGAHLEPTVENQVHMSAGVSQEVEQTSSLKEKLEEQERRARVNAAWEQMNSGLASKLPKGFSGFPSELSKAVNNKPSETAKKPTQKRIPEWMMALGMVPKKATGNMSTSKEMLQNKSVDMKIGTSEDAKKVASAALSAVRDVNAGKGKVEITEVQDFAGKDIEVKKLVDADSKEAAEKAKAASTPSSALDTILEQIKKKQKLSVLDKTKKDWGEYKEDNRGLGDELDAYKKSSNQYLDRVSFLQRTDLREFERERDARLSLQAKRRPADMREDEF